MFMVQLRDENHRLLPGIEAGDVGPKLGDHAIDTGAGRETGMEEEREWERERAHGERAEREQRAESEREREREQ